MVKQTANQKINMGNLIIPLNESHFDKGIELNFFNKNLKPAKFKLHCEIPRFRNSSKGGSNGIDFSFQKDITQL